MPELPEVETIRQGLIDVKLVGKTIKQVDILSDKSFIGNKTSIIGAQVTELNRRGKLLIIATTKDYITIHLRMTGQVIYIDTDTRFGGGHPTDSLIDPLPDRHTRVAIEFTDGSTLFFNDQRKFGFVEVLDQKSLDTNPFLVKLGPEPLDKSFTLAEFIKRFDRKKRSNIKAAILDQHVVAGVGNIYADEALFLAQIHPETPVSQLTKQDFGRLLTGIRTSMLASLDAGGSTMDTYRRTDGTRGNYLNDFGKVYGREGQPCPVCGTQIVKIKVAGRGTHFCPKCQPLNLPR